MDAKSEETMTLDEALAEPIVRAMMAADGLSEADVRAQMLAVAANLRRVAAAVPILPQSRVNPGDLASTTHIESE